jgi:hypothetical protein
MMLLAVTACSTDNSNHPSLEWPPQFGNDIIALRVAEIEMADATGEIVDSDAKYAFFALVENRLRAAGNNYEMKFTLNDAYFIEREAVDYDSDDTLGFWDDGTRLKIDGYYRATISMLDGDNIIANATINAHSMRMLPHAASDSEKAVTYNVMRAELLQHIETQLESQLRTTFKAHLAVR